MATRKELIQAARDCLDTPFHHQGRLEGVGLDCAGLVVVAGAKVGIEVADMTGYARIPDGNALTDHCDAQADRVLLPDAIPGDVILMTFDRDPQHLAIISDITDGCITVVHAWMQPKKVVENVLPEEWKRRIVAVYRLRGLD